jgi:hypothetical protein
MREEKVKVYPGGMYAVDISKLGILHHSEVVLTNEQVAKLLASTKK